MHQTIEPSILYFGTPVIVISTLNEDQSTNIAPMSSAWWLGWSCMLGLDASSKTIENLKRTGECVLNLAAEHNVGAVDRLALLTGSTTLPPHKRALGYRCSTRKFEEAGVTPLASELVHPERIREFPIHLEATVQGIHEFACNDPRMAIPACAVEVTIRRVHVDPGLLDARYRHRIDPQRWRPLIMSFRQFFGLAGCIHASRLAVGPEEVYAPWKCVAKQAKGQCD